MMKYDTSSHSISVFDIISSTPTYPDFAPKMFLHVYMYILYANGLMKSFSNITLIDELCTSGANGLKNAMSTSYLGVTLL